MNQMGGQARKGGLGLDTAKNTLNSVYITGLPGHITEQQLQAIFSSFGFVKRLKMYTEGKISVLPSSR